MAKRETELEPGLTVRRVVPEVTTASWEKRLSSFGEEYG
jgi:hypothetical protein